MTDRPRRPSRSPQEKKKLSYERDCVNVYGQNDKASRKAIPRKKAASNRGLRRKTTELVRKIARTGDDTARVDAGLADATFEGLHPERHKYRDLPIGVMLDTRPVTRRFGADRVPTRNIRESARSVIEQASADERRLSPEDIERRIEWINPRAKRRKAERNA